MYAYTNMACKHAVEIQRTNLGNVVLQRMVGVVRSDMRTSDGEGKKKRTTAGIRSNMAYVQAGDAVKLGD